MIVKSRRYPFPAVLPDLPSPTSCMHLLNEMHDAKIYSNFGPLGARLAQIALDAFGSASEACVPCSSATAGLSAALLLSPPDRPVIAPAFTFAATLGAIRAAQRDPLVMDVCPRSWAIEPDALDKALASSGAGAVVLVAPFGMQTDFSEHIAICRRHGALVVIDCASGLGVQRPNACTQPDVFEVFSLHATKPLGIGEGGLIFAHASREEAIRAALNFALTSHNLPQGPVWGFNGKLSEMHAAVGIVQLERYAQLVAERQAYVQHYVAALADLPQLTGPTDSSCAPWQMFPVLMPSNLHVERLIAAGAAVGIEIRRYYRPSLSLWPDLCSLDACPVSEDLAERMVALPVRRLNERGDGRELLDLILPMLHHVAA